jgi:hypothetical protein
VVNFWCQCLNKDLSPLAALKFWMTLFSMTVLWRPALFGPPLLDP